MTFLADPLGFTPSEFRTYVTGLKWSAWRPKYCVLHNTAEPNLRQWTHAAGKPYEHQRIVNLNHYYKGLGWHSGPHLFISPSLIWVACDLTADGVHASCYNHDSIGVEMVGDYGAEPFDSGDGAKVRDNAVAALAILHQALRLAPETLRFHKECIRDHHDCPGKNVNKSDVIQRIKAAIAGKPVVAGGGSSGGAGATAAFESNVQKVQIAPEPKTADMADYVAAVVTHAEAVDKTAQKSASVAKQVDTVSAYNQRAATIYAFWLAAGFTPAQACGLLAQADAESSLKTDAVGDHAQAFGLHQWHPVRVDAIRNGCGVDLRALPPLEDQLKAARWELEHTERDALGHIKAAKTPYDAGYAAARFWERPASPLQYDKRGATALTWASYFARHPVA